MDLKYSTDAIAAARSLQTFTVIIPLVNARTTSESQLLLVHIQYVLLYLT
jgi:hypothetical protein